MLIGEFPSYLNQLNAPTIHNFYSPVIDFFLAVWLLSFPFWLIAIIVIFLYHKSWIDFRKPIVFAVIANAINVIILLTPIFEWYVD